MLHLDTHVAVWLRAGEVRRLRPIRKQLSAGELVLSPYAFLELQVLFEIGRIRETAAWIFEHLQADHGLEMARGNLEESTLRAAELSFTRDPFDRLIAGHALSSRATLLTADQTLLQHVSCARWG